MQVPQFSGYYRIHNRFERKNAIKIAQDTEQRSGDFYPYRSYVLTQEKKDVFSFPAEAHNGNIRVALNMAGIRFTYDPDKIPPKKSLVNRLFKALVKPFTD